VRSYLSRDLKCFLLARCCLLDLSDGDQGFAGEADAFVFGISPARVFHLKASRVYNRNVVIQSKTISIVIIIIIVCLRVGSNDVEYISRPISSVSTSTLYSQQAYVRKAHPKKQIL
jgi:hypothetical protein